VLKTLTNESMAADILKCRQNLQEVLNKKAGSDPKMPAKLDKAKEIFKYNYADFI
jgi:hypothetical protein